MLLRRLRDRVLRGGRGLRCIALAHAGAQGRRFPRPRRLSPRRCSTTVRARRTSSPPRRLPAALDTWGDGSDKLYQA